MKKFALLLALVGLCVSTMAPADSQRNQSKSKKVRIGVVSFAMETCTFCPRITDIEHFEYYGKPFTGDAVLNSGAGTRGFVHAAGEYHNVEVIGAYAVHDPLGGSMGSWVTRRAFDKYTNAAIEQLRKIPNLNAVYLPLHGAMAVSGIARPEAEFVRRIKQQLGDIPVAVTLDLHANEDAELANYADIILIVKRFPHYDFNLMGERAARLLIRQVRGVYNPVIEARRPNIAFATVYGGTHQGLPRDMMERARRWENRHLDTYVSVAMGFPFADVPDMGMSLFVMTNDNRELAARIADDMNDYIRQRRAQFEYDIPKLARGVEQGLAYLQREQGPVVLANLSDRLGDATHILSELIARKRSNYVVATISDKAAIETIKSHYTAGDSLKIAVGGHTGSLAGKPVQIHGKVAFVGQFRIGGDTPSDLVAITFGANNWVLLTPTRYQVTRRAILDHAGVPVDKMDIFVVKSRNHFRRGFMETGLAKHAVVIDAPGHGPADIGQLTFKNLPKGTYSRFLKY
ncbi:M81 family metallopeptidase [Exilibacterium tricleocarpae]|uniref:M81 family metallopeptidase n=1 Tax=Exilibacterium tricleocarpae TaxID=2591008 RepID=A0A545SQI9_9GAMM|nr:M81 family metallopeptidase [Exilibacterium tricleocarpae]TQV67241.1 M81 family metallopeptidase [Exilibacterium tricleocarpae]